MITIETEKAVAFDSPDHIQPHGTKQDNTTNLLFNEKLRQWLSPDKMHVLDIGCSGGGFVKSILDNGGFAVGLEGSDYSKKQKRAEWATIPDNLFTTDATAHYQLFDQKDNGVKNALKFDVITAWEFIEHIREEDLPKVFGNIDRHLNPGGIIIMSVSPNEEIIDGVVLHQCVHEPDWWYAKFIELGYCNHHIAVTYFGNDMVRWDGNAPGSFHVVLTRNKQLRKSPKNK
jgi:cyclopropane fatty-acyl-phospholipid synthase-like methyltransferase